MSVTDKTHSFRGPADLSERLESALEEWFTLLHERRADAVESAWRAFATTAARRLSEIDRSSSSAARFRAAVETVLRATEKAVEDLDYADQYRAWIEDDAEAAEWRRGSVAATASRWRDE